MEDVERIARLEAQHQEVMRVLQETREDMKCLRDDMHEVRNALTRWKGLLRALRLVSLVCGPLLPRSGD
jgi:sensor histidine kinase regulating citrate/malate metabolism